MRIDADLEFKNVSPPPLGSRPHPVGPRPGVPVLASEAPPQSLAPPTVGDGTGNRAGGAEFAAFALHSTLTAIAQPIQLEESS